MSLNIMSKDATIEFRNCLKKEEKSAITIEKYIRDIQKFNKFISEKEITRELVISYKNYLKVNFAVASVNSMLAAVNKYLKFYNLSHCCVKQLKMQKKPYCSSERELNKNEYIRLLNTAKSCNKERMFVILQTLAGTGIRISELKYFKVEQIRLGEIYVSSKNKIRVIMIPKKLKKMILSYAKKEGIREGEIFITKSGKSLNRSNIWSDMKKLSKKAGIPKEKVFPHNLRKLFARSFYDLKKDIAKLADVLGHSNINTTRIYVMTSGLEHQRDINKLGLIL
ncbi:tyrosine-type recombinase/integrase [uncultured Robinsoniella sp.]|uniref:tyrosine-type recombinase/integrase n=1 Tax=uncultured Robinsoniella sp. TaxID=904190 RepID=UPI00374F0CA5